MPTNRNLKQVPIFLWLVVSDIVLNFGNLYIHLHRTIISGNVILLVLNSIPIVILSSSKRLSLIWSGSTSGISNIMLLYRTKPIIMEGVHVRKPQIQI